MTWKAPDPGELFDVVGIEAAPLYADQPNAYNEQSPDWKPMGSRRANVEQLSGREYWFAQQASSAISVKVTMRYVSGMASLRYRLIWQGMILNIASVINPDGLKIWHVLMCMAKAHPAQPRT